MYKTWHNKCCYVTYEWNKYTFHNLRDFSRTDDESKQEEFWTIDTFHSKKIIGMDMIITPFSRHDVVAHTMLTFHFSDGKHITLSVEAQLKENESYEFRKAMFLWYHNLYIRWTESDHLGLRHLRGEHPIRYPLHLNNSKLEKLFVALVHKTNKVYTKQERYALLWNNCTSTLRNEARHFFPLPHWHRTLFFAPWLPFFLKKKWALKLTEKTIY